MTTQEVREEPADVPWAVRRHPVWTLGGLLMLAVSLWTQVRLDLVTQPAEIYVIDLDVYREGARSLLLGRPVYDVITASPQFLPFTYPPFAAVAGIPLAFVPLAVAAWAWTALQVWLLWWTVGRAFAPLLERAGARAGFAQGGVAATLAWTVPVAVGLRLGQVNALIVALCLADLARRPVVGLHRSRSGRRGPPGTPFWPVGFLIGVATAIKLTPGVFWLHFALTRRWRMLAASVLAAAGVTLLAAALSPSASAAYWTQALFASDRLGPNGGSLNQSLRGAMLRAMPGLAARGSPVITVAYAAAALVALTAGMALAARLHRRGHTVAVVGAVGLTAVLVSPVSWDHHTHWALVAVGAVLADGRDLRRLAAAVGLVAMLTVRWPKLGSDLLAAHAVPRPLGLLIQDGLLVACLLCLLALWWTLGRRAAGPGEEPSPAAVPATVVEQPAPSPAARHHS